ncbi:hypothetical protein ACMHYB_48505 [Sorangium sp. So ce1128]
MKLGAPGYALEILDEHRLGAAVVQADLRAGGAGGGEQRGQLLEAAGGGALPDDEPAVIRPARVVRCRGGVVLRDAELGREFSGLVARAPVNGEAVEGGRGGKLGGEALQERAQILQRRFSYLPRYTAPSRWVRSTRRPEACLAITRSGGPERWRRMLQSNSARAPKS